MPWDQLGIYVTTTPSSHASKGGGFFPECYNLALYCDHSEVGTFDRLANNILGHLAANVHYYEQFHIGGILKDAEGYFKFGSYCDIIVDLIIIATTKALSLNLSIFQKG